MGRLYTSVEIGLKKEFWSEVFDTKNREVLSKTCDFEIDKKRFMSFFIYCANKIKG